MIDQSQLREPVTWEDLIDQEEYMDQVTATVKTLMERLRFQYKQDTWMSTELWEISQMTEAATSRLHRLREAMTAAGAIAGK